MISRKVFRTLALAAVVAVPVAILPMQQAQAAVFIGISVGFAPPALPVYVQPPLPAPGYIWTPGYWSYGDAGYYWVPGVWVQPPSVGLLWTPGYWGYEGGSYLFHGGYWGPHVGFYGGVNYGFGYGGVGFFGGEWRGREFAYNSAVANFGGVHVTNVYVDRNVVIHNTIVNNNHIAYNGGPGGIQHQPSAQVQQWSREQHVAATTNQMQHQQFAAQDRSQFAAFNHGRPGTVASVNNAAYHQTAEQHMRTQPLTTQDRTQGHAFQPNGREANQDQRIANGLKTGQMTSGEAARATAQQSRIDQQVRNDRGANGGTLTNQERGQINREQNNASRNIYNDNHNGNTIAPNAVDTREANQQQRTANGLRSGQMTSGEAARGNLNQSAVDQQVHNNRVGDGGAMNGQQRGQINREQNANSNQIYNGNHNNVNRQAPPAGGLPHEAPGSGGYRPQPAARPEPAARPAGGGERREGGREGGEHKR